MKILSYMFLITLLVSCSSGHRKTSAEIRELIQAQNFEGAIDLIKKSSLAEDKNSSLLYFIELGMLEHYQGNFEASSQSLSKAKSIVDEQFTTKVSGKMKSALTNDNNDLYYGEKFEASLVYFYLALNSYMQSLSEPDLTKKKEHLLRARAEIVDWDSFLTEMKNDRLGKALFKEDLLAKTFGAMVHEAQGNMKDDQVAFQLYQDAAQVFFRNYNLYPSFNRNSEKFKDQFAKLPDLTPEEINTGLIAKTEHSLAFEEFLKTKILKLARKVRPQEFQALVTKFGATKKLVDSLNQKSGNVSFLLQDGLIAEKIPKRIDLPMIWGPHQGIALSMGMGDHVSYELPSMGKVPSLDVSRLEALDASGKVVASSTLSVIAPLGEIAEQAVSEHALAIGAKTATRVAAKHIAAIAASVILYEQGRKNNDAISMTLAVLGHRAAVISINESEKADVRYWSTLPSNIRMGSLSLPKGNYFFRAVFGPEGATQYRVIELGQHEVSNEEVKFVTNNRNRNPVISEQNRLPSQAK